MTTPTQVIDVASDAGKLFVKNVNSLKKELNINGTGEKIRQVKDLSPEQIKANPFLRDFMNGADVFDKLEIKNVSIGNFGRKGGYTHKPNPGSHFRFFVHLGPPEIYYLDDHTVKDKMIPLLDGQGFIVSSLTAPETIVVVYQEPIRIIHNSKIQALVPKIRPRNYSRTTLVYDLDYNITEEELQSDEEIRETNNNEKIQETNNEEIESNDI